MDRRKVQAKIIRLKALLRSLSQYSGPELLEQRIRQFQRSFSRRRQRSLSKSYSSIQSSLKNEPIFSAGNIEFTAGEAETLERLCQKYKAASFQILSGGWEQFAGSSGGIRWNWQPSAGFEWDSSSWHEQVSIFQGPGKDIKIPWELGRCHHFPQLAMIYAMTNDTDWAELFAQQLQDFCKKNKVGRGTQWRDPMSAGIRIVNWICAYDIFISSGHRFSADFDEQVSSAIGEHIDYLWQNLEWNQVLSGNHYLANLAGIIFSCLRLKENSRIQERLHFCVDELYRQILLQFHNDGSNFEASTCYHRLSLEICLYSLYAIQKFAPSYDLGSPSKAIWNRMAKGIEFCKAIELEPAQALQIGDNDSGRLLKLSLDSYSNEDTLENPLNFSHVQAFQRTSDYGSAEKSLIQSSFPRTPISGEPDTGTGTRAPYNQSQCSLKQALALKAKARKQHTSEHQLSIFTKGTRDPIVYPNFGLIIYREGDESLFFRCGDIGQNGLGGHAHNDQLSLCINTKDDQWRDPGTYTYTGNPEIRNTYRSVRSHYAPKVLLRNGVLEPSALDINLFVLEEKSSGICLFANKEGFFGVHYGYGFPCYRLGQFEHGQLLITDFILTENILFQMAPVNEVISEATFSAGYGMRGEE